LPSFDTQTTAAVAIVDADLFLGEVWARSPYDRVVTGFGYTGSAVIGDTEVQLFADETRIGDFFNSSLLTVDMDDVIPQDDLEVPGGALLRCIVRDAAATSLVFTKIALEELMD